MFNWLLELDKQALLYCNSKHSSAWDTIMFWISDNDSKNWIPLYILLLILIIYRERSSYRFIYTILFVAAMVVFTDQISVLVKNLVERPRPTRNDEIADMLHIVNNYRGGQYGFPSSHAANVFGVAAFLSNQFKHYKWSLFLFVWATVVSYSRLYLGVHYPLDVICGALLGALTGIQCYVFKVRTAVFFERRFEIRKEKKAEKRKTNRS